MHGCQGKGDKVLLGSVCVASCSMGVRYYLGALKRCQPRQLGQPEDAEKGRQAGRCGSWGWGLEECAVAALRKRSKCPVRWEISLGPSLTTTRGERWPRNDDSRGPCSFWGCPTAVLVARNSQAAPQELLSVFAAASEHF